MQYNKYTKTHYIEINQFNRQCNMTILFLMMYFGLKNIAKNPTFHFYFTIVLKIFVNANIRKKENNTCQKEREKLILKKDKNIQLGKIQHSRVKIHSKSKKSLGKRVTLNMNSDQYHSFVLAITIYIICNFQKKIDPDLVYWRTKTIK